MNAITDCLIEGPEVSQHSPDDLYAEYLGQATALKTGSVAGADALVAAVAASCLPRAVFRSLAEAIAKATGFDAKAYLKQMEAGRTALISR